MANLITRAGWKRLDDEARHLWKVKRPQVTEAVKEAAALGDRSENAEYKEGKRLLREIDRRLRYLGKRLDQLKIVDYSPEQEGKIFFGAWLCALNEDGIERTFRIVGADEIGINAAFISINSPMAKALIGKSEGDEVEVSTPSGVKYWEVIKIWYQPGDET